MYIYIICIYIYILITNAKKTQRITITFDTTEGSLDPLKIRNVSSERILMQILLLQGVAILTAPGRDAREAWKLTKQWIPVTYSSRWHK